MHFSLKHVHNSPMRNKVKRRASQHQVPHTYPILWTKLVSIQSLTALQWGKHWKCFWTINLKKMWLLGFFFWYQRHVFNEGNVRRLRVDHSAPQTPHHAFAVKRVNDFPLTGYYSNCDVLTCWGVLTINGRSSWKRNLLKTVSIMQIFEGWKSFLGKDHQMFVSFLH